LFGELRAHPVKERALRRAGRATARQYRWSEIVQRVLVPRVHCLTAPIVPLATTRAAPHLEETEEMRVPIDDGKTALASDLLGAIAERLEALKAPYEDIAKLG
jgi:hypothetical protein